MNGLTCFSAKASGGSIDPYAVGEHLHFVISVHPGACLVLKPGHRQSLVEFQYDFRTAACRSRVHCGHIAVNDPLCHILRPGSTGIVVIAAAHGCVFYRQPVCAHCPEALVQTAVMLYLHRLQHFHLGAVQVLVDYRDFIPHNTVIHVYSVTESGGLPCGKAGCLSLDLTARVEAANDFIAQYVVCRNSL